MDENEALAATTVERHGVADLLESLEPSEWDAESACPGWTVCDVAAHLTLTTRLTVLRAVIGLIRARGNLDRLIFRAARERAREYQPGDLVAQVREHASSASRPPGTTVWDPLLDVLAHGQDIARPLGRTREMPLRPTLGALTHVWSTSGYGTPTRFAGLRFVATDAEWSAGDGSVDVRGPAGDLLLLSTGRPAGLAAATGPGVPEARRRLGA